MKAYLIGYDLNKDGQDYKGLYEKIKELSSNNWWHCLDSTWIIKSNLTADQILEKLKPFIDANDHILVIELGSDFAGYLSEDCGNWLLKNLN